MCYWLYRLLSEEESKERFAEVDENEDGRVSWKEYVSETFGVNPDDTVIPLESLEEQKVNFLPQIPKIVILSHLNLKIILMYIGFLFTQMLSDDKALFLGADKNNDGYLDINEYLPFTHPEEDPSMLPIVYRQTLEDKDTNGDGQIDFSEFIGDRGGLLYFLPKITSVKFTKY